MLWLLRRGPDAAAAFRWLAPGSARWNGSPFELLPPDWQQRVLALQAALGITRTVAVRLAADVVGAVHGAPAAAGDLVAAVAARRSCRSTRSKRCSRTSSRTSARLDWLWNGLQCVRRIAAVLPSGACGGWAGASGRNANTPVTTWRWRRAGTPSPWPRRSPHWSASGIPSRALYLPPMEAHSCNVSPVCYPAASRAHAGAYRAVLAIVLVSGVTARDAGRHHRPQVGPAHPSTTDGVLRPGDVREITANGLDGERYYRVSADAQGRLTELYKEDGKVRPIDGKVRTWITRSRPLERAAASRRRRRPLRHGHRLPPCLRHPRCRLTSPTRRCSSRSAAGRRGPACDRQARQPDRRASAIGDRQHQSGWLGR